MTTIDNNNLFSSGPCSVRATSWRRQLERRTFAGLHGELVLDLGARSRTIVQQGRLQAATAADLHTALDAIAAFVDGTLHTLIDNHGHSYPRVLLESFEPTTPVACGTAFWCDYTLTWRQLP